MPKKPSKSAKKRASKAKSKPASVQAKTQASTPQTSLRPKTSKVSILVFGDSPAIVSGFGTVIKNVFKPLAESDRYHIDIFGISDRGDWKDPKEHPYHVYLASPPGIQDPYARARFIDIVRGATPELQPPWDVVFFLNDPFVLENPIPSFNLGTLPAIRDIQKTTYLKLPQHQWFKTAAYWPVDTAVKPHWVLNAISLVDYPVAYTKYAKNEIEHANLLLDEPVSLDLKVIYHGNNRQDFHPLPKDQVRQFRQKYFLGKVRDETFLVITVARNQRRKDLPRTMRVFKEFQKRRPDSYLYIHAEETEMWGSLREAAHQVGLVPEEDYNYPDKFNAVKGFPPQILNLIYNAADAYLSTTQGEGWGLPLTEAMATKTPVVAPNITSIPELFNTQDIEDISDLDALIKQPIRGFPVKAGSTSSEWICHGALDLERIRPLTNVDDAVAKLLWVYDHPTKVKPVVNRAYSWVNRLSWDKISAKWDKLFQKAYHDLEQDRAHPDRARTRARKINTKSFPGYYTDKKVQSISDISTPQL